MTAKFLTRRRYEALEGIDQNKLKKMPGVRLQRENYGWPIYLVRQRSRVIVAAGCRWFTLEQALKHWTQRAAAPLCTLCRVGDGCNKDQVRARKMLRLLPKIRQRARSLRWPAGSTAA
jgi:hypothetical protein